MSLRWIRSALDLLRVLALGLAFGLAASGSVGAPAEPIRLGFERAAEDARERPLLDATRAAFEALFTARPLLIMEGGAAELLDSVRGGKLDFVIAGPVLSAALERTAGARAVASEMHFAARPELPSGAAAVVLKDSPVRTLAGLSGRTLAAPESNRFGALLLKREIQANPNASASSGALRLAAGDEAALEALFNGRAEGAALTLCRWEALPASIRARLRVLEPAGGLGEALSCVSSSGLQPGWSLLSLRPQVEESVVLAGFLRAMPPAAGGIGWGAPVGYEEVREILDELEDPEYLELTARSFEDYWRDYGLVLAALGAALLALLLHSARSQRLVRRRTVELTRTLEERDRAQARAKAADERLAALERAGIVGEFSSVIAHDLKHPLAVIHNYIRGLKRLSERDDLDPEVMTRVLSAIDEQSLRASGMIDRVRSYAKLRLPSAEPMVLSRTVEAALDRFAAGSRMDIRRSIEPGIRVEASPVEIEVALANILRNARDAMAGSGAPPRLSVKLASRDGMAELSIEDNGPALSEEAFARLEKPLASTKPDGLGLGLAIVRRIVEASRGRMHFERCEPHGLRCVIRLPLIDREEGLSNRSAEQA